MRLTIIPSDGAVYKDGKVYNDLTWQGTPQNIHALQWFGVNGWIEFADGTVNQNITELPTWVDAALAAWGEADIPQPEPEPTTPTVVSMRQARLALLQFGLLTQVDAAIAAGSEADQITWEYATEVSRSDPMVSNLAITLGLTEHQLDGLFTLAATL